MNQTIRIDQSRCKACGACRRECTQHLPVFKGADPPENNVDCIGCLHCYSVCPENAVIVTPSPEDRLSGPTAPFAELTSLRRSCRKFTEGSIDKETLQQITDAAALIPSGGNRHSHMITILTRTEIRTILERRLEEIYRRKKRLLGSPFLRRVGLVVSDPETRVFLKDRFYFRQISYLLEQFDRGIDPIFYNAPIVILVHTRQLIPTPQEDCILAAYNMILAAEYTGLGTCFVSLAQKAINSSRYLKKLLSMEMDEQVHAVFVIGHPDVEYHRPIHRAPVPLSRL
jgi:nitroreductase/NAD-dependent dihydropyrimidine dehydrogenase PreA subunit